MPTLRAPGTGKELYVSEEGADFWRSLGYKDSQPEPAAEAENTKKTPAKKAAPTKNQKKGRNS